jgi:hypothetical protein
LQTGIVVPGEPARGRNRKKRIVLANNLTVPYKRASNDLEGHLLLTAELQLPHPPHPRKIDLTFQFSQFAFRFKVGNFQQALDSWTTILETPFEILALLFFSHLESLPAFVPVRGLLRPPAVIARFSRLLPPDQLRTALAVCCVPCWPLAVSTSSLATAESTPATRSRYHPFSAKTPTARNLERQDHRFASTKRHFSSFSPPDYLIFLSN